MDVRGYFEYVFEMDCIDNPREVDPSGVLEVELGISGLWPLDVGRFTAGTDLFFDVIEVLHDLGRGPLHHDLHHLATAAARASNGQA